MKLNSSTSIIGSKVILVPYKKKHVPKYHRWMQRKDLQEATASEPLTEEEEYKMQQSWYLDDDKCTFIVLDRKTMMSKIDEVEAMIGDTNLYLSERDGVNVAEIGIMIAENHHRLGGKGTEALSLLLRYGCDFLKINVFEAKVGLNNTASLIFFQKAGFKLIEENKVFSEATLSLEVDDEWKKWLNSVTSGYTITNYDK